MAIPLSTEGQENHFDQLGEVQFDPVEFLNQTLPSLNLTSQSTSSKQSRTASLQSTSTEVQLFLSKISTHSIKSSSELNALTDEILRSGNRLAYEVEVLRGDINSLYELLSDSLKDDISRFVVEQAGDRGDAVIDVDGIEGGVEVGSHSSSTANEPDFIRQLRLLGMIKSRLEAVIYTFGEALKWPIPPSEVNMATSLISVSAPELGVANSDEDDKAREYTRRLRNDITETLESDGGGPSGLAAATKKVNDLRELSQVWRGTAEEKARNRVVENLAKLVDERRRVLDIRTAPRASNTDNSGTRSSSMPGRASRIVEGSTNTAAGIFRNLQKLRDEIYLD